MVRGLGVGSSIHLPPPFLPPPVYMPLVIIATQIIMPVPNYDLIEKKNTCILKWFILLLSQTVEIYDLYVHL